MRIDEPEVAATTEVETGFIELTFNGSVTVTLPHITAEQIIAELQRELARPWSEIQRMQEEAEAAMEAEAEAAIAGEAMAAVRDEAMRAKHAPD